MANCGNSELKAYDYCSQNDESARVKTKNAAFNFIVSLQCQQLLAIALDLIRPSIGTNTLHSQVLFFISDKLMA